MLAQPRGAKARAVNPNPGRAGRPRRVLRALGTALAGAILVALVNPAGSAGPAARVPAFAPVADSVTPPDIVSAMNVQQVPVSYVVLVDVSGSMLADGLFSSIQNNFADLVGQFGPQDSVAVDTFGNEPEVLRGLGPVDQGSNPAQALNGVSIDPNADTDTGGGLQLAYSQLEAQTPAPKVAVVLLLTDGKPDPPQASAYYMAGINSDSTPDALSADLGGNPAWKSLRTDFAGLSQRTTVLGCGVALRPGLDLSPVVDFVFADPIVDDQSGVPTLHSFVSQAQTAARTAQAAGLLRADSGLGVTAQISASPDSPPWQGYPVGNGSASATVTFTADSTYVPMQITNAQIVASGNLAVTASGLPSSITVSPGHPASYPVTLHWQVPDTSSATGGSDPVSTELHVTGSVSSPWTATIVSAFAPGYHPGTLIASVSTLSGTLAGSVDFSIWLLYVLGLLVLIGGGWLMYLRTHKKLSGSIEIGASGEYVSKPLPDGRRADLGPIDLGGETARVLVRSARRKGGEPAVHIRCVLEGARPMRTGGRCEWAGSLILAGSWQFQHKPTANAEGPA